MLEILKLLMKKYGAWCMCPVCHKLEKIAGHGTVPLCFHADSAFVMQKIGPILNEPITVEEYMGTAKINRIATDKEFEAARQSIDH